MTFNGIPLHPLVVHAAVVFVPLAALLAIAYVVPKWRWAARWPAVIASVVAAVTVWLAATTGENLKETRHEHSALIETHEMWAGYLQTGMWILAAAMVIAFVALPHVTRLKDASDRQGRVAVLEKPMMVVLPILAVVVLVLVFFTGDAGARSVWAG